MKVDKIKLPFKIGKPVLALGSQTKNRVCFARGDTAYMSPIYPDLSDPSDYAAFEKAAGYFLKKGPKLIAYDLHPEYRSSKYASGLNAGHYVLYSIQHHHAHIASCMAENSLGNRKVIGIALDGTGLGADKRLWGAEFLICNYSGFKRVCHLKEIPLLGGEMAIREPVRALAAWLYATGKDRFLNSIKGLDKKKRRALKNMYITGFNSPLSSSMGRLFDAAGSLVLGKNNAAFEAELAIELEKTAKRCKLRCSGYKFRIVKGSHGHIIDPSFLIEGMISDLSSGQSRERVAYRFHLGIADMIRKTSLKLKSEYGIDKVVLSGGVFQNNLLLSLALDLLYKEDFRVFTHKILPPNDSCIALGQAAVANFRG